MKNRRLLTLVLAIALACSMFSGLSLIGVNAGATSVSTDLNKTITDYGINATRSKFNGIYADYSVKAADTFLGLSTDTVIGRFTQACSNPTEINNVKRYNTPRIVMTNCGIDTSSDVDADRQYTVVVMMYNNNNSTYTDNNGTKVWPNVAPCTTVSGTTRALGITSATYTTTTLPYGQWVPVVMSFTITKGATDIALAMDGNDGPLSITGATYYCNGTTSTTYNFQVALTDCYFYVSGIYKTSEYGLAANKISSFNSGVVSLEKVDGQNVIKTVRNCDGKWVSSAPNDNKNYNSLGYNVNDFVKNCGKGYYTVTTKVKEDATSVYAASSVFTPYLSSGNAHAQGSTSFTATSTGWTNVSSTMYVSQGNLDTAGATPSWMFRLQGGNTIAGADIYYTQDITITYSATDPNATPTPTTAPTTAPKTVAARVTFNAFSINYFRSSSFLFFASDGVDSGTKTSVTFTVTNESSTAVTLKAYAQNEWNFIATASGDTKTIAANTSVDFTVSVLSGDKSTANLRLDCVDESGKDTAYGSLTLVISGLCEASLNKIGTFTQSPSTGGTATGSKLTAFTPAYPATPTASPAGATATPVPTKTLVNGDAEGNGTDGWLKFSDGAVSQVSGGASGTGHAMQYTGATSLYGSIGYNLGPAIIKDPAHGYNGAGAGEYKLSFYTKMDSTSTISTGDFTLYLNSICHKNASDIPGIVGGTKTASDYVATYMPMNGTASLTTSWTKVDVTFTVTQKYLDTIMALYNGATPQTNAYDLILRLDGSSKALSSMTKGSTTLAGVKYLVDDVTLVAPNTPTSTPKGNATAQSVVGRQFTFTQDAAFFCSNTWTFVTADMVKNGVVTYKVTIGNASKETISLNARLQVMTKADGKDQWVDATDLEPESYDLDPNTSYTFTITAAAESTLGDAKTKYTYANYFLRLDGKIPTGAVLIFAGISAENLAKMTSTSATAVDLYQLPSWMKGAGSTTSGDTVLYASAACAVISAVALVYVVSRKKNEEEA